MYVPLGRLLGLLLCSLSLLAYSEVLRVPSRPGVHYSLLWSPAAAARETVVLFPGGDGGFGQVRDGLPQSDNFLVRTLPLWQGRGINVAIVGRPDDGSVLSYDNRITEHHLSDIGAILKRVRQLSGHQPWLAGTSRGTVSATAAAIRWQAGIAGLILSSSIVSGNKPGTLTTQDLAAIRLPVLLLHHRNDACPVCRPQDLPATLAMFSQATDRQLQLLTGGAAPLGKACGAWHYHGYTGLEAEAVDLMADWVLSHTPPGARLAASAP